MHTLLAVETVCLRTRSEWARWRAWNIQTVVMVVVVQCWRTVGIKIGFGNSIEFSWNSVPIGKTKKYDYLSSPWPRWRWRAICPTWYPLRCMPERSKQASRQSSESIIIKKNHWWNKHHTKSTTPNPKAVLSTSHHCHSLCVRCEQNAWPLVNTYDRVFLHPLDWCVDQ